MTDQSIPAPTPPKLPSIPPARPSSLPTPTLPPTPVAPISVPKSAAAAPAGTKIPNPTLPPTPLTMQTPTAMAPPPTSVSPPLRPLPPIPPKLPPLPPTAPTMAGKPTQPPLVARPTTLPPLPPAGATSNLPKPPTAPSSTPPPKPAEYKQSPLRFLPFILGAALLLGIGYFVYSHFFGGGSTPVTQSGTSGSNAQASTAPVQQVTLTYWGLWEPSTITRDVFGAFEQTHPNIKVNYQQQSYKDYKDRLQTAISSGQGPDVFRFHASWLPMLRTDLSPIPTTVMSPTEYQNTFYAVAVQQLGINNQLYGIPLMYDGLALYYNEDALRTANAQPPATWADFKTLAQQLTIRSNGKISRAGAAIGNATNVEHFSDIIGLLLLQNGANPANPTSQQAQDAMSFYTNFVKTDKVWNDTLPSSTIAFARGDVAMMLAPSWRAHDIKALNPNLKFKIVPVPQLASNKITWASFWAEGVNVQSPHQAEAWELLKYLSSSDALRRFYSAASKERAFGEIYPRKDMAGELATDPYASAYVSDAPNAQSWYLNSFTHDNGINDFLIKYYQDAVNAILNGQDVSTAMNTVALGTNQILRQYNLNTNATSQTTSSQ